jgi:hypothetical protein
MLLNGGKIVADGAVKDVAQNNPLVSSFINGVWSEEV